MPARHLFLEYALPTTVDTEEFERLIREADEKDGQAAEQLKLYLLALSYYKGDLLPKSSFEEWVVPFLPITTVFTSDAWEKLSGF